MGGVDKADQYLHPYLANRKSLVWFKKLLLHMMQRMVLNAYILWKNVEARQNLHSEFLDFKKNVIQQLLVHYSPRMAQMMTAHHQRHPQRPPRGGNRPNLRTRRNQERIRRANEPRRQPPRDRADLGSDSSDDDNHPHPDADRIRIPVPVGSTTSVATRVVPSSDDIASAGSSRQPQGSSAALVGSTLQDDMGFQPLPPVATAVSPGSAMEPDSDDSQRSFTVLQPQGQPPSPQPARPQPAPPQPAPAEATPLQPLFHQRVKMPPTEKQKNPQKRCKVHWDKYKTKLEAAARGWKKDKKTPFFCPLCPGSPGLCSTACYDEYHKTHGMAPHLVIQERAKRVHIRSPTASPAPSESPVASRTRGRGGDRARQRSLSRGRSGTRGRIRHTSQSEDVDDPATLPQSPTESAQTATASIESPSRGRLRLWNPTPQRSPSPQQASSPQRSPSPQQASPPQGSPSPLQSPTTGPSTSTRNKRKRPDQEQQHQDKRSPVKRWKGQYEKAKQHPDGQYILTSSDDE